MRLKGFSLLEMMGVLAIAGIMAGLALPPLSETARTFRARDQAQDVLSAIRAARTLSIKRNEPVLALASPGRLTLHTPSYSGSTEGYLVAVDTVNWTPHRVIPLKDIKFLTFPPQGLSFCPTGEARFRKNSLNGDPVCNLGNLGEPGGDLTFEALEIRYAIEVNPALGNARLRLGE